MDESGYPEHPGVILRRHIKFSTTHSARSVAWLCGIKDIDNILNEQRNLTEGEATSIGYLFGDEELWQKHRKKYEEYIKYISEQE